MEKIIPKKKLMRICQFSFRVALKLQISGAETRSRVERGQQGEVQVRVGLHPSGDLPVFSLDILQKNCQ